ncbi:motility protein A [Anaerosporobacter faecicola]|uniref:motility protein A n=1 Tax=Anaerosporobacter faecicola TaxID=2718714 RepID=UPI001439F3E7|nr:motility protein A [Anaerosporobacter faecicola]
MDIATIGGLIVSFILLIFGIIFDEDNMRLLWGRVGDFINYPSMLITFGGSFMAVFTASKSIKSFLNNLKSFKLALKILPSNESATITTIIELSNIARKEGLLALEEAANNIEDAFLKKGILLIVDGTDPELVRSILETELISIEGRHKKTIAFWEDLATMGPAWGMIGTLVGLINMLKKMNDPSSIGPQMALALITTLYGSLLANWICTPIASKLKLNNDTEVMTKEVMVEGLLSIQAGENPRVIEEKLKSFLSPSMRNDMTEEEGGEVNG